MDLFSTLTFFPLVLQIGLSGMTPGLARAKPEANEQGFNGVEAVAPTAPERGFVKKTYGATAPY
jgi:hypothetical protein